MPASSTQISTNEAARYKLTLAGTEITQSDAQGVEELLVEEHLDMLASLRVRIGAGEFDWSSVAIGDTAEASFGGSGEVTFTGVVTAVRHYSKKDVELVEIQALDPAIKLASSRNTRIWEDVTDSDVVSAVLGDAGVDAGTVDSTSTTHKYVLQRSESDLNFLKKLAARNGFMLRGNQEGKIDFSKPQFTGEPLEFARDALMSLDYTVSHQNVPPGVTVLGWNYVEKQTVEGTASSADITPIGAGANAVDETGTIWQDDLYITDVWVADQPASKDMAVAELERLARSFVRGRGVIDGSGDVRAGVKVRFTGFAEVFNAEGVVVGTRHRVQDGVYTTEFFFESNTMPQ